MGKKRHPSKSSISSRDESAVFLDEILQWLCELQSKELEIFDEKRFLELAEVVVKKMGVRVFYDLDRNYRNAYNFLILIHEQGKSPSASTDNDYDSAEKLAQFKIRVDVSRKGGFFRLRVYEISLVDTTVLVPTQERSKSLFKLCEQLVRLLKAQGLVQIPDALIERHINGQNVLGGEVTVRTQLFGEI
ncbi:hypothetical protein C7B65_25015 [Phormidesmis priestleyi ULC007]|uniref:Uncharacterized protein n=1 Tax=Phormidesmis priestleyi ULC007 TaxID=1920490 RepID=A0A2T1D401_9CYAN|nr:hypothetical protein [Phormidesmis priestleyi]PSB15187.1 hypothetical protein C7B65_25015 [Phormidesmis priestleyi ULC007]PZO46021.1 MAG: hypothetical protein DCF14_23970 [Phormidesmis priestleyi]